MNNEPIKLLELFGGIGAPRAALRNIGIPVKSIDYVEIDPKPVNSYRAMFPPEINPQDVRGWNLRADILVHGSPCQSVSIAGKRQGNDEGSGTQSSLMWETIRIIREMGLWKPKVVIWENVKGVLHKGMRHNFQRYLDEMESMGYVNSYEVLNAMDYGLPQKRERVFTISILGGPAFDFGKMKKRPMQPIEFPMLEKILEPDESVSDVYDVTQPSILECIGKTGIRRASVITDFAYTVTCRQDRTPAQVVQRPDGRYRYLTERECWRLQGLSDDDFDRAQSVTPKNGRYRMPLYHQAGNSMPVPVLEAIFEVLLKGENDGN